ncbi:MAG: serine/threonine protein kinase [Eubacterium sp.]|nr:serine/threonine protein kinase [Eubacterium sp.]
MNDIKKFEPLWGSWYATEKVGEGSFGKVYKIERKEFGNTYTAALKHIRVPQSQSEVKSIMADGLTEEGVTTYFEGVVESIISEFVLMSKLKGNSNIVSYEDHMVIKDENEIGWDIFIRMEFLTGLFDYIRDNSISRNDIIKLGIDMCKALERCQKYNIIHRDIKPENIFVSDDGDFKLGDFGIARQIEKTAAGLSQKGTFAYIAPEVYKGENYGSSVDIYSLGIVMYRLLNNNRAPFMPPYPQNITPADRERALIERISGKPLEKPVNADGRLAEIILKACAYKPEDRYKSPRDMRADLEDIIYSNSDRKITYAETDRSEQPTVSYAEAGREDDAKTVLISNNTSGDGETEVIYADPSLEAKTEALTEPSGSRNNEEIQKTEYISPENKISDNSYNDENKTVLLNNTSASTAAAVSEANSVRAESRSNPVKTGGENIRTADYNNVKPKGIKHGKIFIAAGILVLLGVIYISSMAVGNLNKANKYESAQQLLSEGSPQEAKEIFTELGQYEDAEEMVKMCDYIRANQFLNEGSPQTAKAIFSELGNYEDSEEMVLHCDYSSAVQALNSGDLLSACEYFEGLGDYSDSQQRLSETKAAVYERGIELYHSDDLDTAEEYFNSSENIGREEDYLLLIKAKNSNLSDISQLTELTDFEDTKEILKTDKYIEEFLIGNWTSGEFHLNFYVNEDDDGTIWCDYYMPITGYNTDHYKIEDAVHKLGSDEAGWSEAWSYDIVSENQISVYVMQNGQTYTFTRNS